MPMLFTYGDSQKWKNQVIVVYGGRNNVHCDTIQNDIFDFRRTHTVQVENDTIIGIRSSMVAFKVTDILSKFPKSSPVQPVNFFMDELFGFSFANFNNKLVILTGGSDQMGKYQSNAYALEVDAGCWKTKNSLPPLVTPRYQHSSCVVGNSVYVVGGYVGYSV